MNPDRPEADSGRRKRWLFALALVFLFAGLFYAARWYVHGRDHAVTDDAYVAGNLIRVTPRVSGTVVAVLAENTDQVARGQVLVRLDDTDARLALEGAEADLAETVRRIGQSFANRDEQRADLAMRQRAYEQAEADLKRRARAVELAAVSLEEAERAQAARDQARAARDLASARLAAAEAAVSGTSVATHPAVRQAEARVRKAWLELARCVIRAPEAGQVEKRSVQLGQQVAPGNALMALVPMNQLWVEANFKEDQLRGMSVGQSVKLVSDLYGRGTVFHGKVAGLSPGTGSVFSLLPPQNASGNWIKIVQRLPVRIALDSQELARHPLRVGLSMKAEVELGDPGKERLPAAPALETRVYRDELQGVEERIRAIVKANLARKR